LGKLKRALLAGRSATRFAGSAMLEMLYAMARAGYHKMLSKDYKMKKWMILIILSLTAIAIILSLTVFKDFMKAKMYIVHMESDDRIENMKIDKIINTLEIKPGDSIADIGAGSGLFSRKFASIVTNSGKVFAVDINKDLLKHIDKVNKGIGIKNIITISASENDPKLPEKVNLIFICDTLHYVSEQEKYIKTISKYLNTDGRIAVISFKDDWPPMANKFYESDLTNWMNNCGLRLINTEYFIEDQYFVIYQKK